MPKNSTIEQSSVPDQSAEKSSGRQIKKDPFIIISILLACVLGLTAIGLGVWYLFMRLNKEEDVLETGDTTQEEADQDETYDDGSFRSVCQHAGDDYAGWEFNSRLTLWSDFDNPDKLFFKTTPEATTDTVAFTGAEYTQTIQVIGQDLLGYMFEGNDGSWSLNTFNLMTEENNEFFVNTDHTEYADSFAIEAGFIDENEAIVLAVKYGEELNDSKAQIIYVNGDSAEVIWEDITLGGGRGPIASDDGSISLSPDKKYFYVIDTIFMPSAPAPDGGEGIDVRIFEVSTMEQIDKISMATHPVWVGNTHILYHSIAEGSGVYLYDTETEESLLVEEIDNAAYDLLYSPLDGGLVVYHKDLIDYDESSYVYSCEQDEILSTVQHGNIRAIVDEKSVVLIRLKYNPEGEESNATAESTGFYDYTTEEYSRIGEGEYIPSFSVWSKY